MIALLLGSASDFIIIIKHMNKVGRHIELLRLRLLLVRRGQLSKILSLNNSITFYQIYIILLLQSTVGSITDDR